jgi:hypothetical protein
MGVLGAVKRIFGGNDPGFEFRQNLALQAAADNPQGQPGNPIDDAIDTQRRISYLTVDTNVIGLCYNNKALQPLLAPLSPLNSTIILDKRQADLKRIRMENYFAMLKLTMDPTDFEANGFETIEGLRLYAHDRVNEAVDGWKGHLCTENVRRMEVQTKKMG